MTLSELSIQRPVLAVVMSTVIVIFGFVSFRTLGVREYPAVIRRQSRSRPPTQARTRRSSTRKSPNRSSKQNAVPGIRTMASTSRDGQSQIVVEFDLSVDLDAAANDVRDKVGLARRELPADVDPPVVEKADADATPIIFMTLRSDSKSIVEVANLAATVVAERMKTFPASPASASSVTSATRCACRSTRRRCTPRVWCRSTYRAPSNEATSTSHRAAWKAAAPSSGSGCERGSRRRRSSGGW